MKVLNWWEALCDMIEANRDRPLVWGEWDCCQFAALAVLTMTGVDYRESFPKYEGQIEALRLEAQFGSVEALLSSVLGESKPVAFAKRGDVLAIQTDAGTAAGICLGLMCVTVSVERLQFLRSAQASAAWSIG